MESIDPAYGCFASSDCNANPELLAPVLPSADVWPNRGGARDGRKRLGFAESERPDRISSGCGVTAGSSEDEAEGGSGVGVKEEVGIMVVGYGVSDRLRFATSLTEDPRAVGARKVKSDRVRVCNNNMRDGTSAPKRRGTAHNYFYNNMGAEQPRRDYFKCDEESSHEAQYPRSRLIRLLEKRGLRSTSYWWDSEAYNPVGSPPATRCFKA